MYIDAEKTRMEIAESAFKEGSIYATYNLETKQCTSIIVVNFDHDVDSALSEENITMPAPAEGEGSIKIEHMLTVTAAASENYVDVATASLIRKPKVRLTMLEDKDFDPVNQSIVVRDEPYTIMVDMVDYTDKVIDPPEKMTLKLKDRDKLCVVSVDTMEFPTDKSFQIKARSSGIASCIRAKDNNYKYVPGLLSLEVIPPKF